jgi:predicted nucleic acid-binding Zn ribbon protein
VLQPPDDDEFEEAPDERAGPFAFARWWPYATGLAFVLLLSGWVYYDVPAEWRAGRHWHALLVVGIAACVLCAWLRFLALIRRGQRAAAEECARALELERQAQRAMLRRRAR